MRIPIKQLLAAGATQGNVLVVGAGSAISQTDRWIITTDGALEGRHANSQLTWTTGLGAISHVTGPSDQTLSVRGGVGQILGLGANNTTTWEVTEGPLRPAADNTRDLGASNVRVRTGYFGTSVITPQVSAPAAAATSDDNGPDLPIFAGHGDGAGIGGSLFLTSGNGGATGDSGNVVVDVGTVTGGLAGVITIGTTRSRGVTIGRSGFISAINGELKNNNLPVPVVLSVTSVDLKTVGTTDLYTVPTGKSLVVTDIIVLPTTATAAVGDVEAGVGVAAGEDDIAASQALTGLTATTERFKFLLGGISYIAQATESVKFGVDTADTGTALVADVYLIGYLI